MGAVVVVAVSLLVAADGNPTVALSNLGFSVLLSIVLPVLIVCESKRFFLFRGLDTVRFSNNNKHG